MISYPVCNRCAPWSLEDLGFRRSFRLLANECTCEGEPETQAEKQGIGCPGLSYVLVCEARDPADLPLYLRSGMFSLGLPSRYLSSVSLPDERRIIKPLAVPFVCHTGVLPSLNSRLDSSLDSPFLTYVSSAYLVPLPPHSCDGHLLAYDEAAVRPLRREL